MSKWIVLQWAVTAMLLGQGAGDLNPGLRADPKAVERFQDMRVGLSIHWGPSSQTGYEISWTRGKKRAAQPLIPVAGYDRLYKTFNPVKFDAEEWARLAKRWGMRYLLPAGKHHDGFSLWFSRFSEYDMEGTPFRRDVMKELADACRRSGIVFGSYYSNLDWNHPDWTPYEPEPGPLFPKRPDSPNLERYLEYMRNQLTELIRGYGVEILQFDGDWPKSWTHEIGSKMYRGLRAVSPAVILSSRIDRGRVGSKDPKTGGWNRSVYAGDYEERERHVSSLSETGTVGREDSTWSEEPWQAWITVDRRQWSWNPTPELLTPDELIRDIVQTVGANGNLAINAGPRPDGSFHRGQIALLDEAGRWMAKHGESIYGTRGGPFRPAGWGVSTRKGNTLHILKWDGAVLQLPALAEQIASARLWDGSRADVRQSESGVSVRVREDRRDRLDTIVVLQLRAKKWGPGFGGVVKLVCNGPANVEKLDPAQAAARLSA